MLAAMKRDCLEYVKWDGPWTQGPSWFNLFKELDMWVDEYGEWYAPNPVDGMDIAIIDNYTIFIWNGHEVGIYDESSTAWTIINDTYVALTKDIYEYFLFDGNPNGPFPEWFERTEDYRMLVHYEGIAYYIDGDDVFPGSPFWMFLRDGSEAKYMEPYYFDKIFEHREGSRIQCSLA